MNEKQFLDLLAGGSKDLRLLVVDHVPSGVAGQPPRQITLVDEETGQAYYVSGTNLKNALDRGKASFNNGAVILDAGAIFIGSDGWHGIRINDRGAPQTYVPAGKGEAVTA